MDGYVFRLTHPDLHILYWVAVGLLAAAWPVALWKLLVGARAALRRGQAWCALGCVVLALCPALLGPSVVNSAREQFLSLTISNASAGTRSLFDRHSISLREPITVRRGDRSVLVSDGTDAVELPPARQWRLQYMEVDTEFLIRELQARAPQAPEMAGASR